MLRKSLFLGLMVLLGAVLVSLVLRGRNQEKAKKDLPRVVEVVREYKPTATRVINPADLQVVRSVPIVKAGSAALPPLVSIRNNGTVAYANPELEGSAIGRDGRVLASETLRIEKEIPPGGEISVDPAAVGILEKQLHQKTGGRDLNVTPRFRVRSAEIAK